MARIYSYVVRYDSGFAPNPFYGYCTLATCKPDIRHAAKIDDWVVGSASNDRSIRRGGHLVYAMRVTETATFDEYSADPRFAAKKPFRRGSRKQSCGDNIYFRKAPGAPWCQLDSFHSKATGQMHEGHVNKDTGVGRVLISDDFIYFGGTGPSFPASLRSGDGRHLCKSGIGRTCFDDPGLVHSLEEWIRSFKLSGYQGPPQEWISLRGESHD
jgi:hypothetical protein